MMLQELNKSIGRKHIQARTSAYINDAKNNVDTTQMAPVGWGGILLGSCERLIERKK